MGETILVDQAPDCIEYQSSREGQRCTSKYTVAAFLTGVNDLFVSSDLIKRLRSKLFYPGGVLLLSCFAFPVGTAISHYSTLSVRTSPPSCLESEADHCKSASWTVQAARARLQRDMTCARLSNFALADVQQRALNRKHSLALMPSYKAVRGKGPKGKGV